MLFYISIILSVISLTVFIFNPKWGILFTLIAKPIIDTTWGSVFFGIKLTYIMGVGVPLIVMIHAIIGPKDERPSKVPLFYFWMLYLFANFISMQILIYVQPIMAVNVFFKIFNGFIGFYMFQRYFRDSDNIKKLLIALLIAGIFPIGIGVYQLLGGHIWTVWDTEGLKRNIGLYHDQASLKYYIFQTITAILLLGSYYFNKQKTKKILLCIYFTICLPVLYKLYVKSGNAVFVLWMIIWNGLQKKVFMLLFLLMSVLVVNIYLENKLFLEIYQIFHKEIGVFSGDVDLKRSFAGRWYGWAEWFNDWKNTSILIKAFGTGESGIGAHNDYIFSIVRSGIFGFCAYLALLLSAGVSIFMGFRKGITPFRVIALMIFVMWGVETIGLVPSAYPSFQWFAWGLIGMSLRFDKENLNIERV